ncbi:MAG: FAD-binding protein [Dehalococcoidales bacterium]|nr:FAD-binding protein [Dehalococcoidales bacterium]
MEHVNSVEHFNADVAVLGTGGAGMAAAITAAEGGAKVIVLEKNLFQVGHPIPPVGFGFALTTGRIAGKSALDYLKKLFLTKLGLNNEIEN